MSRNSDLYIDELLRILDPTRRDLVPEVGARGFTEASVRGVDESKRQVTAMVSTPSVDRYMEIVEPESFRESLPGFMRNPVLCANHLYSAGDGSPTVIGRWLSMTITKEGLLGVCQFMDNDALAESWWERFKQKCISAFSVGFISQATEMRAFKMPNGTTKKLRVHTLAELIEVSAVTIPANRESLVIGASANARRSSGNRDSDQLDDDLAPIGKLSNRQLAMATRTLTPVIRQIICEELNPEPGSTLFTILGMIVDAIDTHRGHGSGCDHGLHEPSGYRAVDDPDLDDEIEDEDEELSDALRHLLAEPDARR